MIRTAARAAAIALISFSAMGLAGTAVADEDTTAGDSTETSTGTSEVATATTPAGSLPEACTLLPLELAHRTIDNRTELVLTSTSGGVECLYQAADNSGSYAVDLDVSEQTSNSLMQARDAWSSPGVDIADATDLGEGAFTGLNNDLDAVVVCAKDGVQFDIEVWAPDGAFAQQQVMTLAQRYCAPDTDTAGLAETT